MNIKKLLACLLVLSTLMLGTMQQAEASRHHRSVGRQIQRIAERNLVRFVDRTMRAHIDNYVSDIYYWHRVQRNRRLQEYRAACSYRNVAPTYNYVIEACDERGRKYAVGGFQMSRPLNESELRGMKKVALALQTGEAIKADSHYERRRIIELCRESGISVQTNGSLIYVFTN